MKKESLQQKIYNYPTEHEAGFTKKEINTLLKDYPNVNMDKFNDAMMGNTCMVNDKGEIINYHCDVLTALRCGIENRSVKPHEFD